MSNRLRALRRRKVFAPLLCSGVAARGGGGLANAETTTWVNAVVGDGGSVSAGRQTLVDNLITSLKSGSIWTNLDRLFLFAGENSQSALRDIVAAAQATLTSAPTFAADRGYTTDGAANFVDTAFNPGTGTPKFVRDSAAWSMWSRTAGGLAASGNGTFNGTTGTFANLRNATDQIVYRVNQTASVTLSNTDGSGLITTTRTASNATAAYRNGSSLGTDATTSDAVISATFQAGHVNSSASFVARQWAACAIGAGRDAATELAFYNAMQTYMTAVGA